MRRSRIALSRRIWDTLRYARDLLQGRGERQRTLADLGAGAIGLIFARAADRHLHEPGGKWPEDEEQQRADEPDIAVVVAAPAEIETEIGEHGDRAGDRGGEGHEQGVAVLDMADLVRQHA